MEYPFEDYLNLFFNNDGKRGSDQYFEDRDEQDLLESKLANNPALELEMIHRAFTHKKKYWSNFSPYQIGNGLNYIFNSSLSNLGFCFQNETLDQRKRLESIAALFNLISNSFGIAAGQNFSPTGDNSENDSLAHINETCYMFWDTACIPHNCDEKTILACLDVMKKCARSSNFEVVHGALHGLGHLINNSKGNDVLVRSAISQANFGHGQRSDILRRYAEQAKQGQIQ